MEAGRDSLSLMPRSQGSLNPNADVLLWLQEPDKAKSQTLPRELPDMVEKFHVTTSLANLISTLPEKRQLLVRHA